MKKTKMYLGLSLIILSILWSIGCSRSSVETEGWVRWRGPAGDGTVQTVTFDPRFPENESSEVWHREYREGFSSMTISENRLYTAGLIPQVGNQRDTISCLDTETGETIWETEIRYKGAYQFQGPRAQPVLEDGILYWVSSDAIVMAFKARNGKLIWSTDLKEVCGAEPPIYAVGSSPVIENDTLLINACQYGVALDKKNGDIFWSSPAGANGYATPVLFDYEGERIAAILGQKDFYLVRTADGSILDSVPWTTQYDIHATDPVLIGDSRILLSSAYGAGSILLDYGSGRLETVWQSEVLSSQFSSLIQHDGYIYGIDGATYNRQRCYLKCIDPLTGEEIWSEKLRAYASLMLINDTLVILDEHGFLMTVSADPEGYELIAEKHVFESRGTAWIAPVFADGQLYLRTITGEMAALSVN